MGILNFTEIHRPTKSSKHGASSTDLDAFEKFSEEFFEKVLGAKLITRMRRGPDNSLDLKIEYHGKTALVSCKHYAHTDTSIGVDIEKNVIDALFANDCDKFIGLYSTSPTAGLITKLEGLKNNPRFKFDYEIFKNTDIESTLLDSNNAKGWLLAARYFPQSYSNLFQRFVIPINHYKICDVESDGIGWSLAGPYGALYCKNHTPEEIVKRANDSLTNVIHKTFFNAAIKDAIDMFPRYFGYKNNSSIFELSLSDIKPLWDIDLIFNYSQECNTPIIVSALWSFWDPSRAQEAYLKFQRSLSASSSDRNIDVVFPSFLSIGCAAARSSGGLRNIFSRLVAFSPGLITTSNGECFSSFENERGLPINWGFKNGESLDFVITELLDA